MDGFPNGNPLDPKYGPVVAAHSEQEFRERVAKMIEGVRHGTKPEDGWPWPWEDSRTTDYAYAFDGGDVWASCFGRSWFLAEGKEPEKNGPKTAIFPDMKSRQKVTLGPRSGLIVLGGPQ